MPLTQQSIANQAIFNVPIDGGIIAEEFIKFLGDAQAAGVR